MLNQLGYQVDRRRDVISTYINVESIFIVCWDYYQRMIRLIKYREMLTSFSKTNRNVIKIIEGKYNISKHRPISNKAGEILSNKTQKKNNTNYKHKQSKINLSNSRNNNDARNYIPKY